MVLAFIISIQHRGRWYGGYWGHQQISLAKRIIVEIKYICLRSEANKSYRVIWVRKYYQTALLTG